LGSNVGDKALGLARIRQVGPSRLDTAGQLRGRFAVGGGVEVGGDHMTAKRGEPSDRRGSDQAEASCDEHSSRHYTPYLRIWYSLFARVAYSGDFSDGVGREVGTSTA